jgi:glycosyltransferase involved in cell wall biosynthesis
MKVAIVTRFPKDPAAPRGGVESVSVNLVQALSAFADLTLHVVTTDADEPQPRRENWHGVHIHRLPRLGRRTLFDAIGPGRRQVRDYLRTLAPDVIHAHDVYGLMVRGLPQPRVFTVHGFIYRDTQLQPTRLARVRALVWRWIETAGWADQPHVISISPYVRERISAVCRGAVHDIDNPVSERCFDIPRRPEPGRVFSAAWISPRKNTLGLLRGFARLARRNPRATLRLAGTASDAAYLSAVRDFLAANNLTDRVQLLGQLSSTAVAEELSRAAVFALASLEENAPMGIEEAMAAAVPVVASNRCGMPYMVRDGQSGYLVNPLDPDDIASQIGRILDDGKLAHSMGDLGRLIALDRFHPAVVARRTREVYTRACETAATVGARTHGLQPA